jgi:hypothetical protein
MYDIWELATKLRQEADGLESLLSDSFCEKDIDCIESNIKYYLEEMEGYIESIKGYL